MLIGVWRAAWYLCSQMTKLSLLRIGFRTKIKTRMGWTCRLKLTWTWRIKLTTQQTVDSWLEVRLSLLKTRSIGQELKLRELGTPWREQFSVHQILVNLTTMLIQVPKQLNSTTRRLAKTGSQCSAQTVEDPNVVSIFFIQRARIRALTYPEHSAQLSTFLNSTT